MKYTVETYVISSFAYFKSAWSHLAVSFIFSSGLRLVQLLTGNTAIKKDFIKNTVDMTSSTDVYRSITLNLKAHGRTFWKGLCSTERNNFYLLNPSVLFVVQYFCRLSMSRA